MSAKIAWIMSTYQKPDLIFEIIKLVYREGDVLCLHYDKNSSKEEFEYLKEKLSIFSNVYFFQKYRTFWGSFFGIWSELLMIEHLVKQKIDFDYMINLSGTTVPVRPQEQLRNFLTEEYPKSFFEVYPDHPIKYGIDDTLNPFFYSAHGLRHNYMNSSRNTYRANKFIIYFFLYFLKFRKFIKSLIPKKK